MTHGSMRWFIASATLTALGNLALAQGGNYERDQRFFELTYSATIRDVPRTAQQTYLWIPVPPSSAQQTLLGFEVVSGHEYHSLAEPKYGNRFLRFDLTGAADSQVQVAFRIHRKAYRILGGESAPSDASAELSRYLAPNLLVPSDGPIAQEAARVVQGVSGALPRARTLYDHIVDTMRYDKSGQGWGRGDALYACDSRTGNCTDFHSLYIGQARSLGIPARFLIGFPVSADETSGSISGYHCWAEFHLDDNGWVPLDASEAFQRPDLRESLFGGLDADRVHFTIGRDYVLPGSKTDAVNFSIYPHVEVDGKIHDNVERSFSFRDIEGR